MYLVYFRSHSQTIDDAFRQEEVGMSPEVKHIQAHTVFMKSYVDRRIRPQDSMVWE